MCVDLFADLRGGELFPLGASFDVILVISLFKQYFRTLVYMSVVACFFPFKTSSHGSQEYERQDVVSTFTH